MKDLAPNLSSTETDTDDFVAVLDELLDGEAKKRPKKFHSWEPMNVLKRHVFRDEGSFGGMCCVCGRRLEKDLGVPLGVYTKGLRLGNDDVVGLQIEDMKNLSRNKKLYLVLNLDHTLLNSTEIIRLTPQEEYLKIQTHPLQCM
ncbi:RNA polymerase II C-terminal domain phosphatase-like 4 [Pistacia vera]|uniref:RNA polymerase II C-terminal domain phosphatase-like 4 n=1 Tax=Pistacia vera TaxID=55513 RepID=UPI001262D498|nr:RNA polymerase II C-terminal domain phosphatase-like 4 [Pistacia vera]